MDNVTVKKTLSRVGLVAVIVGIVLVVVGGGDAQSAIGMAGIWSTIAGAVLEAIREVMG